MFGSVSTPLLKVGAEPAAPVNWIVVVPTDEVEKVPAIIVVLPAPDEEPLMQVPLTAKQPLVILSPLKRVEVPVEKLAILLMAKSEPGVEVPMPTKPLLLRVRIEAVVEEKSCKSLVAAVNIVRKSKSLFGVP